MQRHFTNPITREKGHILKTSKDTDGKYTLIEVELQPGGGNPIHYHTRFTETFEPVIGTLGIHHEGDEIRLRPGETLTVPIHDLHRFYNPSDCAITFRARLEPGQPDFENFLIALFGLVRDGKTFGSNQIPYDPLYAAILLKWGDTQMDSPLFRWMRPLYRGLITLSRKLNKEKQLYQRYVAHQRD